MTQDNGEALYRRSLYTFWRRIVGPTEFFDTASRETCIGQAKSAPTRRLHALTTLNDVTYVEAARALAERVLASEAARPRETAIDGPSAWCCARGRHAAENARSCSPAFARLTGEFAADRKAAEQLLTSANRRANESIDAVEHAAYTAVCRRS